MLCLPIFVDIFVKTTWLMRMFPLLLPQDLTIRYFHLLHRCPLERATFSVDILQNTNFFRAFTASASVLAIYIHQFWNTLITPIDQAHQFVSPPSGDAIMDFVNELRYTEEIHFVSRMAVNNLYLPWRAILSMINQYLTGKTSEFDRPRYPVLQMLWGIITSTNVDYAELIWEEFVQAIQTFLTDKANLGSPTKKGRKDKPHVIPYCQFTKLIICHLGRKHNLHQRSESLLHLAEEDHRLGNLKFVPKGEDDEVFEMQIPNELITNKIRNAPYYNAYLEMVAKHDQKLQLKRPAKEKSSKPARAPKPKVTKEKPSQPSPLKNVHKGKVLKKVRKEKGPLKLVDEEEEVQHELVPEFQGEGEDDDYQRAIQMSLKSFQAQNQAPVRALHTPKRRSTTDQFIYQRQTLATKEASTGPSAQPQDDTSANIVRDSPSPADAETSADTDKTNSGGGNEILQTGEEQGDDVANVVNLEEKTGELDEGQAGSDPGRTPESRPPPDDEKMEEDQAGSDPGKSRVALAGPNPEPTHEDFMAHVYPNVHESLKFPADEHVILEDPLSSSGTLSLMKNLDDAYTIEDQFINDKSTEDEPGKLNVEAEVVFMVTVPVYQADTSVPPLSTPVIEISSPISSSHPVYAPIITTTTVTTSTTLALQPPPPTQSLTDPELAAWVTALEKRNAELEQAFTNQNNTTNNLASRIFTLEHRDLEYMIDNYVRETVKENVQIALRAPLLQSFRNLSEIEMKEILHQRMFESGSYKTHKEHADLYEALERSMARDNIDEFIAERAKSRKRHRNDQDPPLTSSKRTSSAWKTTNTRNAPSSSSKQQQASQSDQPIDVPKSDAVHISDSEDVGAAHLPKIKTLATWLRPLPKEDRSESPEPDWTIPSNDLPEPENN
ncbi:retrovirus-related pol polyprotein from transposon TNT 1-94 [Tanacetum coccineum]